MLLFQRMSGGMSAPTHFHLTRSDPLWKKLGQPCVRLSWLALKTSAGHDEVLMKNLNVYEYDKNCAFTWYVWGEGEDGCIFPAGFLASGFLFLLFILTLCTETLLFIKWYFLVWNIKPLMCRLTELMDKCFTEWTRVVLQSPLSWVIFCFSGSGVDFIQPGFRWEVSAHLEHTRNITDKSERKYTYKWSQEKKRADPYLSWTADNTDWRTETHLNSLEAAGGRCLGEGGVWGQGSAPSRVGVKRSFDHLDCYCGQNRFILHVNFKYCWGHSLNRFCPFCPCLPRLCNSCLPQSSPLKSW